MRPISLRFRTFLWLQVIACGVLFFGKTPAVQAAAPVVDSLTAYRGVDALPLSPVVIPGETISLVVSAHDPDCGGVCASECGMAVDSSLTSWSADGGILSGQDNGTTGSPYTASVQWEAPVAIGTYTTILSGALWLALKYTVGIRCSEYDEREGLDVTELGMEAYPDFVLKH